MQSPQTIEGFGLSPQQKRLWRVLQGSEQAPWRTTIAVEIEGAIHAEGLSRALGAVASRHEILRTRYRTLSGTTIPIQVIAPTLEVELAAKDSTATLPSARSAEIDEHRRALERRPFDPGNDGALAGVLLSYSKREHVLLLSQTALAADAASAWNLVGELARELDSAGEPSEAPLQYADFSQWQHELFETEEASAALEFWRRSGLDLVKGLRLSLEESEASPPGFRPRTLESLLPERTLRAVAELATRASLARESVYLAALTTLFSRMTDGSELVLAVGSRGRTYEGFDAALGLFEKFLPVRLSASAAADFLALARSAGESLRAAEERHEYFDLDRLAGPQGVGVLPFAFELHPSVEPIEAGGVRFRLAGRWSTLEPSRIKLTIEEVKDGARARLTYDASTLSEGAAAAILDQYLTLLASALAAPGAEVGSLTALSGSARARVLGDLASTPAVAAGARADACIQHLIADAAAKTPDAPAVIAEGRTLSYAELEREANQLAEHLQDLGLAPSRFAAIYMDRSVEMIVAILAILKAGGAYLPLPPSYPRDRLAFMLEDTQAAILLTRAREAATLPAFRGPVVTLGDGGNGWSEGTSGVPQDRATSRDLAYVIYTSGSTGQPKGVPISQGNLVHSTRARFGHYRQGVHGYLLLSSFAFDSSVPGIFWTLCSGGRLVLPPEGFERDLASLPRLIREQRPSHLLALPSLYGALLQAAQPGDLASLECCIVAGESCTKELVAAHFEALPRCELHNEYGPTEGTVWSTVFDCAKVSRRASVPIGRPIPGARVYLTDERMEPVPIGHAGELHVGGPGVARGYLNRPDLTAAKFIADPFNVGNVGDVGDAHDVARLYKTGDLARWLPDGNLEFLGRLDHQVKIRGYRIELEEIESVLAKHPAIREAVVAAREDQPGDKRLVAYLASRNGALPDAAELRAFVAQPLPEYMVPAHFVALEEFPRLPNGKVDRKALPAPDSASLRSSQAYVAPTTPLGKVLALIWAEVLGVEKVGIHDDFFELGGHSILATQLFARMNEHLSMDLPLRALFDKRSIAGLTAELDKDAAMKERVERTAAVVLEVIGA